MTDDLGEATPDLVKVVVALPHHEATGGESLWALPLGSDRYQIQNVPFFAYGLNHLDVVRARAAAPDEKPEVEAVVNASGHRTLRVNFDGEVEERSMLQLLGSLDDLRASFERASSHYFAIDVEPEGDWGSVCERLDGWEAECLLEYETCEARLPGSFDAAPPGADETSP